jgi:hypothetical protein
MPCLYVLYTILYVGELNPPEIRSRTEILAIPGDCHDLRCEARTWRGTKYRLAKPICGKRLTS